MFKKYVIINEADLQAGAERASAKINHEIAHIKNRDSIFFHIAIASLFVTVGTVAVIFGVPALDAALVSDSNVRMPIMSAQQVLGVFTAPVFIVLLVRRFLHARELRADSFAYARVGDAYVKMLKRMIVYSALNRDRPLLKILNFPLAWFSHPRLNLRLQRVQNQNRVWHQGAFFDAIIAG